MLHRFDAWLIDKFERFSHKWQRMFGQDCFWWARAALIFSGIIYTTGAFIDTGWIVTVVVGGMVNISLFCLYNIGYKPIISRARKDNLSGLANKEKLDGCVIRLVLSIWLMIGWSIIINIFVVESDVFFVRVSLTIIALMSSFYFLACDSLPPSKSKVRQWLESAGTRIKETLSLTPEPVPVPIPIELSSIPSSSARSHRAQLDPIPSTQLSWVSLRGFYLATNALTYIIIRL